MADPTPYAPGYDFTSVEKGPQFNAELADVALATEELVDAVKDIRRSDGALKNGIVTTDSLAPGVLANAASEAAASATEAAASAQQAALYEGVWKDNVAALLADSVLTYTAGQPSTVAAGDYVLTRSEGFSYLVAASGATNQHVSTAGGVKLYVQAGASGYDVRAFGAVGDGATNDTAPITKADASGLGPFDLSGKTYSTTIQSSTIVSDYFNGTLLTRNFENNVDIYRSRPPITEAEVGLTGRKTPILSWSGLSTLWLGTSIPQQGSPVTYPSLIAGQLGFSVTNNAWAGSAMRWPGVAAIDPDGSINQIKCLSMTQADVDAGLALYGAGSVFDNSYDPVTLASQMTTEYRIVNAFKAAPISVVFLDHNHNDRRNPVGSLATVAQTVTGVTLGTTTAFTLSGTVSLAVGDGVTARITGIAALDYAFGRVVAVSGSTVTVAYNSLGLTGTFTSGTLTKVDRSTLYGSADFIVSAINNSGIRYGGELPTIITCGAPSEYTRNTFDTAIWSVNRRLESYSEARGIAFFDVATSLAVGPADHILYFSDEVHPVSLGSREAIARHWVRWLQGGATQVVDESKYMAIGSPMADQKLAIYNSATSKFLPLTRMAGPVYDILVDDFADGNYTGWTATGASPAVVTAPWGSGNSLQCDTTAAQTNSYISQSITGDVGMVAEFDLWMPVVSGLTTGGVKSANILYLRSTTGFYAYVSLVIRDTSTFLRMNYFKTPGVTLVSSGNLLTLAAATKYRVKLELFRTTANGAGYMVLSVDGVSVGTFDSDDIGQASPNSVRIGLQSSNTAANLTAHFGNVAIRGRAERLPLNGSYSIGGNTVQFQSGIAWSVT